MSQDIFEKGLIKKNCKSTEVKSLQFNISEGISFTYSYFIATLENGWSGVYIKMSSNTGLFAEGQTRFEAVLPLTKQQLHRQIGGWAKEYMWRILSFGQIEDEGFGSDSWHLPRKEPHLRKIKSYVYLRSRKIGDVLGGRIWKDWLALVGISNEEIREICKIAFRINPVSSRNSFYHLDTLFKCKTTMSPDLWNILKSDMTKYNVSLCKWILSFIAVGKYKISLADYQLLIKESPKIVRKCRYGLDWSTIERDLVYNAHPPKDRWQYFVLRTTLLVQPYLYGITNSEERLKEFYDKVPMSDIRMWHYYKKAYRISQPYSFKRILHMFQVVFDGMRIYDQEKNNVCGVSFVPVYGSPMKMIRNAIYNHRQEQELRKKTRLSSSDFNLWGPPIKLPEWVENIRIKTSHQLITAGIECEHCIGSYSSSPDIFVREGTVCAQIDRNDLRVIRCYDSHDSITKKSRDLEKRLNKALSPLREVISIAQ
jgi:hypothetical protein